MEKMLDLLALTPERLIVILLALSILWVFD
jgi:hypothetical protein